MGLGKTDKSVFAFNQLPLSAAVLPHRHVCMVSTAGHEVIVAPELVIAHSD
ncbi:MAG: hypothetical protein JNL74_02365 [Fibrobacteres bacterium]|nr:hypothetical protein [Fibrobacterota bacterium]